MNFFELLISNIYFYVFIALFITQLITFFLNKKKLSNYNNLFVLLNNFRIKNIYYEIFIIIVYFILYIGIFFMYRLSIIGISVPLYGIFDNMLYVNVFISLLISLGIIICYFNILNNLFYIHVIRLHFYLFMFKRYEKICFFVQQNIDYLFHTIHNLWASFYRLTTYNKDKFVKKIKFRYELQDKKNIDVYSTKEYKRWEKVNNNKVLFYIYKLMMHVLHKITGISDFLSHVSYSIVLFTVIYDTFQGILYFTQYALLFLFIKNIIRKFRRFYYIKDYMLESIISKSFYTKEYEMPWDDISNTAMPSMPYEYQIEHYIKNNFTVDFMVERVNDEKFNMQRSRRIHIIFVLLLVMIYYFISNKYMIHILDKTFNIGYLFFVIIIILYILHKLIWNTVSVELCAPLTKAHIIYLRCFRIILFLLSIVMFYILLKNKLTLFPNEVLFEIKNHLKITEYFSIEEKKEYVVKYIKYLESLLDYDYDKHRWAYIVKEIEQNIIITDDMTLKELRELVVKMCTSNISKETSDISKMLSRIFR